MAIATTGLIYTSIVACLWLSVFLWLNVKKRKIGSFQIKRLHLHRFSTVLEFKVLLIDQFTHNHTHIYTVGAPWSLTCPFTLWHEEPGIAPQTTWFFVDFSWSPLTVFFPSRAGTLFKLWMQHSYMSFTVVGIKHLSVCSYFSFPKQSIRSRHSVVYPLGSCRE